MRPGFEISGCAEVAPLADDEPAITVPSEPGEVVEGGVAPGKEEPSLIPGKGGEAMVCVQATRGCQTPPLIVPDIHRVLEGTGLLECPDHKLDHGVPDSKCDYCKRALGPLYRHSALKEAREIPILTFDFSGPHPSTVHPAKQLMVIVWCLREVRLVWALGVENRDDPHVVAGLQVALDDLTSLTGGCRAPVLRLHSDKAKEFLAKSVRSLLKAHGIRQTTNSGYDPAANGIAERWVGIVKVRATALLAEHRLPPDYWAYACKWVAYIHNHRVLGIRLNASYPLFGDVVVVHRFLKKPPSFEDRGVTGVCLGHNPLVSGGVTVGTIMDGFFNVIVTAKVRKLGERRPQRWKLHIHPKDPKAAAYVRNDGEVKWHLNDLDVATVEELHPEGAMEVQGLRALGMGWAWYVNDLSKYLPDADTLADMTPAEDISVGMDPGVPLKEIGLEPESAPEGEVIDPYVIDVPFPHVPPGPAETELMGGDAPALLPRSQDVDLVVSAINIPMPKHLQQALKPWSREDLCVRVFQGVRAGGPKARQVCCRETFDMETGALLAREYFDPGKGPVRLPTPALPGCSPASSHALAIRSVFWYSELDPVPESIRAVAARCRARACASQHEARPVVVLRGEDGLAQAQAREASVLKSGGESKVSLTTNEQQSLCHASPGRDQRTGETGFEEIEEDDAMSFASADSQGYRTDEEETLNFEVSLIQLGWQNEELVSDRWVKIADQPEVRVMQLAKREEPLEREEEGCSKTGDDETKKKTVYCVTGLKISKQVELVEASFQLRARLLELNAVTFENVDLGAIPVDVAYVTALSQQEVPDYFAGPAMAKTVTQESRVVFGPEQAEWKEAILAELESFAKLGVYEVVKLKDIRGAEILPGRLVLVVKPNPEGAKGKKKARIVVCGNFQTVHPDEMTSSKTPSYPMLRMLLSLASYRSWPIETWDVSTAFLYARLYGDRETDLDGQYIYMRPPKVIEKLGLLPEGTIWKLKKALYGLRTSPLAWEVERDNSLAELQWEIDGIWYGLTPAKGNPCLWAVVQLLAEEGPATKAGRQGARPTTARSIGVQTEGQDRPLDLLGGVVTYVDDLLFAMPEVHMRPIIHLLLKKYVMKQSGCLPSGPQKRDVQIGFLGCRITRDSSGTVLCDQEKYILHCMHENSFVGESQAVTLKPCHRLPVVDEKLPDEVLPEGDKRKHVSDCQRYIGQLMWLATRTRPDISAVLGICASMMVRTPKVVAAHLVDLWRFVWTTRAFVMSTLSPERGSSVDCLAVSTEVSYGRQIASRICHEGQSTKKEQVTPEIPCFHIHAFTDASFATSQGRSRSGYMVCLVHPGTGEYSVLQWSSRRQTITAFSAPEAEIVAMSEGVMTALLTYDALTFLGVSTGITPQLKIPMRTDSDTGLKQLRNDSIVVRTRPFGKCYSYLRDVCYGTLLHPPCVDPVFEPGKTQKADGLTKILGRSLQLAFMTQLGMGVPSYL